jgi:hypothetical protein
MTPCSRPVPSHQNASFRHSGNLGSFAHWAYYPRREGTIVQSAHMSEAPPSDRTFGERHIVDCLGSILDAAQTANRLYEDRSRENIHPVQHHFPFITFLDVGVRLHSGFETVFR